MQAWMIIELARQRIGELFAEAAQERLARELDNAPRGSTRRRIARALLAFGFFCVGLGRSVGGDDEISDGACAPS